MPQVGDVFLFKAKDGRYSLIKMTKITRDSFFLAQGGFSGFNMPEIARRVETENYTDKGPAFSLDEWKSARETGRIGKVRR